MSYERMHGDGACDYYKSFDRQGRDVTMTVPLSDDGGDQEAAYCDVVAAMVTCDPAELIVDTWLDGFTLGDERWAQTDEQRMANLRKSLLFCVRATCTLLEQAENAARLEGGQSFSEWLEERS